MKKHDSFGLLYSQLWMHKDSTLISEGCDTFPNKPEQSIENDKNQSLLNKQTALTQQSNSENIVTKDGVELLSKSIEPTLLPIINHNVKMNENVVTKEILDWDRLIKTVSNCTSCQLSCKRTNIVIERGSRSAKIMFVGEGPGEHEDLQGIPFVGKSGELLNKMIAALKLNKDNDVYICNTVKCRPPNNRNPLPEELTACFGYLFSQIKLVNPNVIIALGRIASNILLGNNNSLAALRGKIHDFRGYPLITTYHPASLLRNPSYKANVWEDLKLAMSI